MTLEQQANPLINPPQLPNDAPPLDSIKNEHYLPALEWALKRARADHAAIRDNPDHPTFENTIAAAEHAGKDLERVAEIFSNIAAAAKDDEIKKIKPVFYVEWGKFFDETSMDEIMFERVKALYESRHTLALARDQQLLLENTYKGYVRGGALLDEANKKRLKEINERLSEITTLYEQNTIDAVKTYSKVIEDESELDGIPQRQKDFYARNAEKEKMPGKWLIKLLPRPEDIFKYARNRYLREEIFRAYYDIAGSGPFDNRPVVLEIVRLRHEKARMMGAENYAAFTIEEQMAKTPQTVEKLLNDLQAVYKPAAAVHLQKVKDLALQEDGITDLKRWDFEYYENKLFEREVGVSPEDLRPYFSLENVLTGVFSHVEKLFNVSLKRVDGKYPVYHPDVKVYEVEHRGTGELIGLFYTDYYARPGIKTGGAWMNTFRNAGFENGARVIPHVINCSNFVHPAPGKPSLLSLHDVTTVFHEMGHGLHALMSRGRYGSQLGTNVRRDFVELPSQVQERWAVQPDVLRTYAKHYESGETMPEDIIAKIDQIHKFDAAWLGLRQIFLGKLDMAWYTTDPATIESVEALEDKVNDDVMLFPRVGGLMSTNFSHIFLGGYTAGYYGYKWAEVLDAFLFDEFLDKGLYDRATADRLRATIYEPGATEEPDILYRKMMGCDATIGALLRREGLLPPTGDSGNSPVSRSPSGLSPA